jgi:hypothetical protein
VTAFSSSDIQNISISPSLGGCGLRHDRDGARIFRVDCEKCEGVILGHTRPKTCKWTKERGYQYHQLDPWPGWASAVQDIPPTFDEQLERDRMRQSGQTELERLQAMSMAATLGIPVPQALAASLGGIQALEGLKAEPQTLCPDGHANRPGARFCDVCGTSMQVPEAKVPGTAEAEAKVPEAVSLA